MLYRERLVPPGVVVADRSRLRAVWCGVAIGFYLGLGWGAGWRVATLAAVAAGFLLARSVTIELDRPELRVGPGGASRSTTWAAVVPLDRDQTTRRIGPEADARAYLVLRPYVPTAVELTLDDPADPVPYWLVSSRRPRQLAEALDRGAGGRIYPDATVRAAPDPLGCAGDRN